MRAVCFLWLAVAGGGGGGPSDGGGGAAREGEGGAGGGAEDRSLREERQRMVIERLYGPQAHYRAAQRFLRNRTLRKMNGGNSGMTLYDRIMAYRKLKEGEEVSGGGWGGG